MGKQFETVTIKNISGVPFEFVYDWKHFYMAPNQEWTLDAGLGRFFTKKYFKQLEETDEGKMPTPEPTDDPNYGKTYREMHPKKSGAAETSGKPWCNECGKRFNGNGQLMMHQKKHQKEAKLAASVEA